MTKSNPHDNPAKHHHTPVGFRNSQPLIFKQSDIHRWQLERIKNRYPHPPSQGYPAFLQQWWQPADFNCQHDAVWWLGHACVLFQLGGLRIITDPVFSERVSPIAFTGPQRKTPIPAQLEQLPSIDLLVISHDHYDHLDRPTVRNLIKLHPEMTILVPLGLKSWMITLGAKQVVELDWWDSYSLPGGQATFVPAHHWGRRNLLGTNKNLWGGWVIQANHKQVYFAGDTGYSQGLAEISQRLGTIDLAALPIGAYAPRWFMHNQHIDPHQAVQLHRELEIRRSLAIHWGTFELADESLDEPPKLLQQAKQQQNVPDEQFLLLQIGAHLLL